MRATSCCSATALTPENTESGQLNSCVEAKRRGMKHSSAHPMNAFDVLIGLRLSIVRRAADMLVLHFGDVRAHPSGEGTVGDYALHVQCSWRLDGPAGTVTGQGDLWEYAGPGERPRNWSYDDGHSLQD